ncbi:MAG TPA: YifB family Mg chelatase-like AAA ATPase [Nevskiales bacterium]|nr:YifB family Mg chelatase-like AAA ATPase [Nevskiales bacterium]
MTLATVFSRAQCGLDAPLVSVEVHLANGLPSLSIVGLPEAAVKESKDRVRAALVNSGFEFPSDRRITVNLAPADLPKDGGRFDLAIALGILAASGQVPRDKLAAYELLGELSLGGELRPVRGVLPAVLQARDAGRALILPEANGAEAALVRDAACLTAPHLLSVCGALTGHDGHSLQQPAFTLQRHDATPSPDLAEVRGQAQARRALEVAAAGGHSLLMIGPPGSGKSMLAARLPGILPPLTEPEALEVAAIASISPQGFDPARHWGRRPVRAPHHTASGIALVGGGSLPRPGEITLAHHGVLFLDELPEFSRAVLEVLREPLETGRITISRAARQAEFPARFQLVAAMNPCPCGWLGDPSGRCRCTAEQVQRYRARISGPLLDRIDLHVQVGRVPQSALLAPDPAQNGETSASVRARVCAARERQLARAGKPNHRLEPRELERDCKLDGESRRLLLQALERLRLSARASHRILRVARTLADLEGCDAIAQRHLAEAIGYRVLDRDGRAGQGPHKPNG